MGLSSEMMEKWQSWLLVFAKFSMVRGMGCWEWMCGCNGSK